MKLDKKVYLILGAILLIVILGICWMVNKNENGGINPIEDSFYQGGNVALEEFKPLNETTNLSNLLQRVKDKLIQNLKGISDAEANELLDLREYKGLEKRVAICNAENEYTEVWMLKISKKYQAQEIFRLFEERFDVLNESKVLFVEPKNLVMKVQDNIAMIIISEKASEIEKVIDEKMSEDGSSVISVKADAKVSSTYTMEDTVKVTVNSKDKIEKMESLAWNKEAVSMDRDYEVVSGEVTYNEIEKWYVGDVEIGRAAGEYVNVSVMVFDENENMKYFRAGEIRIARNGISNVRTERNANGSISVNIEAIEGGEICISTTNETPDKNANWQKYESGKTYTLEDDNVEINNVYVYYRASTIVTNPTPAYVGDVSWAKDMEYHYQDSYGIFTYVKDPTGKYAKIILCEPVGEEVVFPTYINGMRVVSLGKLEDNYSIFGDSYYDYTTRYITLPGALESIDYNTFFGCVGVRGRLVLPSTLRYIGYRAFSYSGFEGNLVIPDSVTDIDNEAFYGSHFDGELILGSGLKNIGDKAFNSCNFTGDLIIPDSVTYIGSYAFEDCQYFTGKLKLSNNLKEIPYYGFSNCGFTGSLIIPDSVEYIDSDAFWYCEGFTGDLIIPDSVTEIGHGVFGSCSGFNGILSISNSLREIPSSAFYGCYGFTGRLSIPSSVKYIGYDAFEDCSGFTGELVIPNSVIEISSRAFGNCSGLTGKINISKNLKYIDGGAFGGVGSDYIEVDDSNNYFKDIDGILCSKDGTYLIQAPGGMSKNNYSIPSTVVEIADSAFKGCTKFTGDLIIPDNVEYIGFNAFSYCTGFNGNLKLGNGIRNIGNSAFCGCEGFTGDLILPDTLTTLSNSAFYECKGFNGNLKIGNGLTEIEGSVFSGCSGFSGDLIIPDNVTDIGDYAFYNCTGFKGNLKLGNSVTNIRYSAFDGCSGFIGSVTIPESIIEIDQYAFRNCGSLDYILLPDIETIPSNTDSSSRIASGVKLYALTEDSAQRYNAVDYWNKENNGKGVYSPLVVEKKISYVGKNTTFEDDGATVFGAQEDPTGVLRIRKEYVLEGSDTISEVLNTSVSGTYTATYILQKKNSTTNEYEDVLKSDGTQEKGTRTIIVSESEGEVFPVVGDVTWGTTTYTYTDDYGTFTYVKDSTNKYIKITRCTPKGDTVIFPTFIENLRVLSLGYGSGITNIFGYNYYYDNVKTITLPEGLEIIGDYAFYYCRGLTCSLTIPNSVTSIGHDAFGLCKNLTGDLIIPDSVINIESYAFNECNGLNGRLELSKNIKIINNYTFYDCSFRGNLIIPEGVTTIGEFAFYLCNYISGKIEIPSSVTSIGDYAFWGCWQFEGTFNISENVTTIGEKAFVTNATYIDVAENNNYYKDIEGILFSKDGARLIQAPGGMKKENYQIPNSVTTIGDYAFYSCINFTGKLIIPDSVTTIGEDAFHGCEGLTGDLIIPDSVTAIGESAFWNCNGFTGKLVLSNNLTSIETEAFCYCNGLNGNLTIPSGVTKIGARAFADCRGLTGSLIIPDNIQLIGSSAFEDCSKLTGGVVIPDSVTSIDIFAFRNCSGLDYIVLADVDSIPSNSSNSYRIYNYNKLYALTSESAQKYNAVDYWNLENNGDGVFSALKLVKGNETILNGATFEDNKAVTVANFNEDPSGILRVRKLYQKEGETTSSETLNTNVGGTYTATYILQMKNSTTGEYEDVLLSDGTPEKVTRTITVSETGDNISNAPYVTDISITSPTPGEYGKGTEIIFNVTWNKNVLPAVAPDLYITFEESKGVYSAEYVSTTGNISTYKYVLIGSEEGELKLDSYEYGIVDEACEPSWLESQVTLDEEIIAIKEESILMARENSAYVIGAERAGKTTYTPDLISKINIVDINDTGLLSSDIVDSWDISRDKNGSVMAYIKVNSLNSSMYDLYIAGYGDIEATSGKELFKGYTNSVTIYGLDKLITDNVTDMSSMFYGCSSLTYLKLSSFNTNSVTNMTSMFENCTSMTSLILGEDFDKLNGTNMFLNCSSLEKLITEKTISSSSEAMTLSTDAAINTYTTLYVSNTESETHYESATNYSSVFEANRIRPIMEMQGNNPHILYEGEEYYDYGVRVLEYEEEYSRYYEELGYTVTIEGPEIYEDTPVGIYEYKYTLKLDGTFVMELIRTVEVKVLPTLMPREVVNGNTPYVLGAYREGKTQYTADEIKNIWFYGGSIEGVEEETLYVDMWDISAKENGTVMAVLFQNEEDSTEYDFMIAFDGIIVANENCARLFEGYTNCMYIDYIKEMYTFNTTTMNSMFKNCSSLIELDLGSDNGNDGGMEGCSQESYESEGDFITSSVTDMNSMFYNCSSLEYLNVVGFETYLVSSMDYMFYNCSSLSALNLVSFSVGTTFEPDGGGSPISAKRSDINIRKVESTSDLEDIPTSIEHMFDGCKTLRNVLLGPYFDKIDGTSMFKDCDSLEAIMSLQSNGPIGISTVTDINSTAVLYVMSDWIEETYQEIELYNIVFGPERIEQILKVNGKNPKYILQNSEYIENGVLVAGYDITRQEEYEQYGMYVDIYGDLDTSTLGEYKIWYDLYGPWYYGPYEEGGNASSRGQIFDIRRMSDVEIDYSNYYRDASRTVIVTDTLPVLMSGSSSSTNIFGNTNVNKANVLTITIQDSQTQPSGTLYCDPWDASEEQDGSVTAWLVTDTTDSTKYHLYIGGNGGVTALNGIYLFDNYTNCTNIYGLDKLDTSSVKDMCYMFRDCSSLASLDVSNFDTSSVTDMTWMFLDCSSLTSLDVSKWNTSSVTDMREMFNNCSSLTSLDVSKWNTSSVTDMTWMFFDCSSLTNLDTSKWDTSSVKSMYYMFHSCSSLTSLDVSNFDTSNVTDMGSMFYDCSSLTSLDVSDFDTSNVTNMNSMFYDCSSLTSLDVSNFDTSNVTSMGNMFEDCSSLTSLDVSNFDTSNVTSMASIFKGCSSLTNLDTSKWDTSSATSMYYMFHSCSSLTSLDVSNFNTSKVTSMMQTFYNCSSLTSLNVSTFNTSAVTTMSGIFGGCSSLTSLDVSNFDTSSVTNMMSMFYKCSNLKSILLGPNFNKLNGSSMFYNTTALTSIITQRTTPITLSTNTSLNSKTILYVPSESAETEHESGENYETVFGAKVNGDIARVKPILELVGENPVEVKKGSTYTDAGATVAGFTSDATNAVNYTQYGYTLTPSGADVDLSTPGTKYVTYTLTYKKPGSTDTPATVMTAQREVEVVQNDPILMEETYTDVYTNKYIFGKSGITQRREDVLTITITDTFNMPKAMVVNLGDVSKEQDGSVIAWLEKDSTDSTKYHLKIFGDESGVIASNGQYLFAGYTNCTNIYGLDLLDTSNVTNMGAMFAGCSKLTEIDVSTFKTSQVKGMGSMFADCTSLKSIDMYKFDFGGLDGETYSFSVDFGSATYNDTDIACMFKNCSNLESVGFASWGFDYVKNMAGLFEGCSKLNDFGSSGYFADNVTITASMFKNCSSLTNLDDWLFNTVNTIDMSSMFEGCSGLTGLDLVSFNTVNAPKMDRMFYGCSNLKSINLSSYFYYMDGNDMFAGCNNLTAIIANSREQLAPNKVNTDYKVYADAKTKPQTDFVSVNSTNNKGPLKLETSINWNTNGIRNAMSNTESGESRIILTAAQAWTGYVLGTNTGMPANTVFYVQNTEEESMYEGMQTHLNVFGKDRIRPILELVGDNPLIIGKDETYTEPCVTVAGFDEANFVNYRLYDYMVNQVEVYSEGDYLYTINVESNVNPTDALYDSIDTSTLGTMYTLVYQLVDTNMNRVMEVERYVLVQGDPILMEETYTNAYNNKYILGYSTGDIRRKDVATITIKNNQTPPEGNIIHTWDVSKAKDGSVTAWLVTNATNSSRYDLYIGGEGGVIASNGELLFSCYSNCTAINGLEYLDTSNVTSMAFMFGYNSSIKNINVNTLKTDKVKDMSAMFLACTSLEEININNFNTSSVKVMACMFGSCTSLTTLDVSNMTTTGIDNVSTASVIKWGDTGEDCIAIEGMFQKCTNLETIILGENFGANVESMYQLFYNCSSLVNVNTTKINTSSLKNMRNMFNGCSSLSSIDVSKWNTENVTNMNSTFANCSNIETFDLANLNTANVTNMNGMFSGCTALEKLDLTNFNTANVTDVGNMFNGDVKLKSIILGQNFDKLNGTDVFTGCTNLTAIITQRTSPMTLSTDTALNTMTNTKLYVTNETVEQAHEAGTNYETVFGAKVDGDIARVQPILELIGDSEISIFAGTSYTEAGATVAGFTSSATDAVNYTQYGYTLSGPVIKKDGTTVSSVDTLSLGTYTLTYTLTYKDSSVIPATTVTRTVEVVDSPISITTHPSAQAVKNGATANFAVVASGTNLKYQWYYSSANSNESGTAITSTTPGATNSGMTSATLTLANIQTSWNNYYVYCEISNLQYTVKSNPAKVTVYYAPSIKTQPSNQTVTYPSKATFTVEANAGNPSETTYKWQYRTSSSGTWTDISGATSVSYTTDATTVAMSGYEYRCIIGNSQYANAATSNAATLTVNKATATATVVINGTPAVNQTLETSVSTASDGEKTYQWWYSSTAGATSGTPITGATASTYKVTSDMATKYIGVTVSVAAGTNYLACSDTDITTAPVSDTSISITDQPDSIAVKSGTAVSFTVAASGSNLTYQWYKASSSSANGTAINGATSATYSIAAASVTSSLNGSYYYCIVSNNTGSATSNRAMLTVYYVPTISTQPKDVTVTATQNATFSITVTNGNPATTTYQWQYRTSSTETWADIGEATSATYTKTASYSENGYQFRCLVGNSQYTGDARVASNAATLTVNKKSLTTTGIAVTLNPTEVVYTGSAIDKETVVATVKDGDKTLVEFWDYVSSYSNNTNVGTATVTISGRNNYADEITATFNIIAATPKVVLSNKTVTYTGNAITINAPTVTGVTGGTTPSGAITYVYYTNSSCTTMTTNANSGATSNGAAPVNAGTYYVKATIAAAGNYGTATSNVATLTISKRTLSASDSDITSSLSGTSFEYTGSEIKPITTIKVGTTTLVVGTDYDVTYTDNVNVGKATVTITGKGNYDGTITLNFVITAKAVTIKAKDASKTYDGTALTKNEYEITAGGIGGTHTIVASITGTITNVGSVTNTLNSVVIKDANGTDVTSNYTVTKANGTLTITAADSAGFDITLGNDSLVYNGAEQEPSVTVKVGTTTLVEGTDYEIIYTNNENVGTATVTIKGKGNYAGSEGSKTFTITQKPITITAGSKSKVYDGTALTLNTYTESGGIISGHTLSVVITGTITNVGSVANNITTVTISSAKGDVTGNYAITKVPGTLTITAKTNASFTITLPTDYDYEYDGTEKEPVPVVKVDGVTLTPGVDYEVSYEDNTDAGEDTAKVIITGKGNYAGSTADETFTIEPRAITLTAKSTSKVYSGTALTLNGYDLTSGSLVSGHKLNVVVSGSITNVGSTSNIITSATVSDASNNDKTANYVITKLTGTLTVTKRILNASDSDIITGLSGTSFVYTGYEIKPTATIKVGTTTLVAGTDYDIAYTNNVNVGAATITVTGKGNYDGTITMTFEIIKASPVVTVTINGTPQVDQTLTTSVETISEGVKTYQWWWSESATATTGTSINGATGSAYKITADMEGKYIGVTVNVAETANYNEISGNSITTALANDTSISIAAQPSNLSVKSGAEASFTVTATGSNLKYQWYKASSSTDAGTAIAGANEATYTIPAGTVTKDINETYYYCIVGNNAGNVTSAKALLTVYYLPTITTQPVNQTVVYPNKATFAIAASAGNPSDITYQWQLSKDNGATWIDVTEADGTGGTTITFMTKATTVLMTGYKYRCLVGNTQYTGNERVVSNVATLSVNRATAELTVEKYSIKLPKQVNETISYTYVGDGELEVSTSNENCATATLNTTNKTITISTLNNGTAQITLTAKQGANYSGKTTNITVTVVEPEITKVTINNEASTTKNIKVVVMVEAEYAEYMYISESNAEPKANDWKEYSKYSIFTLSSGNVEKTIYVWCKDSAGNITEAKTAKIKLDASYTLKLVNKQTYTGKYNTYTVQYAIKEDGGTYGVWQDSNTFTGLIPNKVYYAKTIVRDAEVFVESSEVKFRAVYNTSGVLVLEKM